MKRFFFLLLLMVFFVWAPHVYATQIAFNTVSATGNYETSLNFLTDGIFPVEGGFFKNNTTWWNGTTPIFTFLFSESIIKEISLSVDNNDWYKVDYTVDNSTWIPLFSISKFYGNIGSGMDSMSTDSNSPWYISEIDFTPVSAIGLRIYATGGDGLYSVGEFQAFGSASSAIPEPSTMILFGLGLLGLAGISRRKKIIPIFESALKISQQIKSLNIFCRK